MQDNVQTGKIEYSTPESLQIDKESLKIKDANLPLLYTPIDELKLNLPLYTQKFAQNFEIPNWGIKDYIRERAIWQKGVESLAGEPGWFYFKIFFKFNTNYGLFGGILDNAESSNTALEYLDLCRSNYSVN